MNEFTKASELIKQIQEQVELHGDDLQIAFCVDKETTESTMDSIIGAIKIDSIEKMTPPRLDLTFKT